MGAIRIEGAEGTTVRNSLFSRCDGTGVSINGYARATTIDANEFVWMGEGAVASWGKTNGVDATDMALPLGTRMTSNICREIGHYEKQVSCYFEAVSGEAYIADNIFYNMPRAGINFSGSFPTSFLSPKPRQPLPDRPLTLRRRNLRPSARCPNFHRAVPPQPRTDDDAVGGSLVTRNLMWNTCRESQDHGPFNVSTDWFAARRQSDGLVWRGEKSASRREADAEAARETERSTGSWPGHNLT